MLNNKDSNFNKEKSEKKPLFNNSCILKYLIWTSIIIPLVFLIIYISGFGSVFLYWLIGEAEFTLKYSISLFLLLIFGLVLLGITLIHGNLVINKTSKKNYD